MSCLATAFVLLLCVMNMVTTVARTLGLIPTAFLGTISCMVAVEIVLRLLYGRMLSMDQVRSAKLFAANVGQAQC